MDIPGISVDAPPARMLTTQADNEAILLKAARTKHDIDGKTHFLCSQCHEVHPIKTDGGTGYAINSTDDTLTCYTCCGEKDKAHMRETGRITLYLNINERAWGGTLKQSHFTGEVINWPGTLRLRCNGKKGKHNIARHRYDVWFAFEGDDWHGVTYGDNTQICHCKRIKR